MKKKILIITIALFISIGLIACSLITISKADITFSDSFETGSLSPNWTPYQSSTLTLNQQIVNSGSYSVKNIANGNNENLYSHPLSSTQISTNPLYMREYVYITSTTIPSTSGDYYEVGGFSGIDSTGHLMAANSGDGEICVFNVGGTLYWGLYVRDENSTNGFTLHLSSTAVTANTWNNVALMHYTGTNDISNFGEDKLTLNGQVIVDVHENNWDRTPGMVIIGGSNQVANSNDTWTYYIDDVAVGDSSIGTVEYSLTTSTNAGTVLPASGNVPEGQQVTITATPPSNVTGERYVFTGWTGSGSGQYTGTNNPAVITMNGPITESATWEHQYYLTVSSAYGTTGNSGWYDAGTTATASLVSGTVAGSAGTQYIFAGWTGASSGNGLTSSPITMNAPETATATWTTQYYLTTSTAYGTGTITGAGWYNAGTTATATLASAISPGTTGIQYQFTNWGTDATGVGLTSNAITMSGPKTATALWQTQYNFTVAQVGVGSDYTDNLITVNGNNYNANGYSIWANANAVYTFSYLAQAVVSSTTTQYLLTGVTGNITATSVTVSAPTTVTATYKAQYYLTVTSQYDSPSPTSAWYDNNTSITAYVSSPSSGYSCSGWTGTGSVPASGSTTVASFAITSPSTLVWNWAVPTSATTTPTIAPTATPTHTTTPTVSPTTHPTATPSVPEFSSAAVIILALVLASVALGTYANRRKTK